MRSFIALGFMFVFVTTAVNAVTEQAYPMPRSTVVPIKDKRTNSQYELYIKLPESYGENPDKKHPVIYSTDAIWHMDMLSGTTEYLMPDAILVGISWQTGLKDVRAHVSRFRDYTVVPSSNAEHQARYQFGNAESHLIFILEDIIPYINKHYQADPEKRGYFGYSLGGQFGAYALLAQPDGFSHYILGSPAVSERSIAYLDNLVNNNTTQDRNITAQAFVSIGEQEQAEMENTRNLIAVLEKQRADGLSITNLQLIKDSDHTTAFPETTIRGIKWLARQINN